MPRQRLHPTRVTPGLEEIDVAAKWRHLRTALQMCPDHAGVFAYQDRDADSPAPSLRSLHQPAPKGRPCPCRPAYESSSHPS